MKGLFLIVALVFSFLTVGQTINQKDGKGLKQGVWQKTYPNSKALEYKGQFKDDKPVGTFTYYYKSTKVKAIIKFDANSSRSSALLYHETGVIMGRGIYKDMKKDSIWEYYGPSGRLSTKETYTKGVLNGNLIVYYVPEDPNDKSQRPAKVTPYKNGVINGDVIEYFDSGVIKSKTSYVNGKKEGIATINHPNGKPMVTERYIHGVQHGWQLAHDEAGKEIGRKYYNHGTLLEGKRLERHLKTCKDKGINPNG